jgi:acetyl-CoA carboxylase biotin carboxyl carrier protein
MRMVMEETEGSDSSDVFLTIESPHLSAKATTVVAECPGVFLTAHPVHSGPLVAPGDRVRPGDIVGLLKIGRLLTPVTAPREGIVTRVAAAPGTLVEFGTRLVEIQPLTSTSVETSTKP